MTMNNHIFNNQVKHLLMAGYGHSEPNEAFTPVVTDNIGQMILSPDLTIAVEAEGLDIRNLEESRDSASITVSNLDIRNLSGIRDNLNLYDNSFVEASESGVIVALSTRNFLATDTSPYSKSTFYVRNNSALSVSVTVTLQIAPINSDNYYVNDGVSYSLIGGNTLIFQPSRLMRFARIRVSAILLANVTVYYFGQT